jgi:orotate phosphoribosyltransferase
MNEQLFDLPHSQKLWHLARQQMTDYAVATGRTFTLKSGRESDFYVDCRVAGLMQPEEHQLGWLPTPLGRLMDLALGKCNISVRFKCWAPVPLGGLLLMLRTEVQGPPIVVPRREKKDHGMQHKVEGLYDAKENRLVPPMAPTLLIEDVITTGGSTLRALDALREVELNPTVVLVLVDREEGGREALEEAGLEVWSVFTQSDLR